MCQLEWINWQTNSTRFLVGRSLIASANGCLTCCWTKDGGKIWSNTADWKMKKICQVCDEWKSDKKENIIDLANGRSSTGKRLIQFKWLYYIAVNKNCLKNKKRAPQHSKVPTFAKKKLFFRLNETIFFGKNETVHSIKTKLWKIKVDTACANFDASNQTTKLKSKRTNKTFDWTRKIRQFEKYFYFTLTKRLDNENRYSD